MSEQYRRPAGVLLVGVLLWAFALIGQRNEVDGSPGTVLNLIGLGAFLLVLGAILWLAVLLLRKRG